ncbi:MAG: rhomboid family intramembrane serine protease [Alphaproteobacteria bacterium]|nr:rhomboid family intramembrane serine protease [Alphaproteobacteria bacterium]
MPRRRRPSAELPLAPLRALPMLMVINIAVFAVWQFFGGAASLGLDRGLNLMTDHFLVSPASWADGRYWTLLTSAFSHASIAHLAFNLLALWVFGSEVERVVGARAFVHLYVAGGIVASLGHLLYCHVTGLTAPALGASGAVMAIAVVAALCFPRVILLLFFVLPVPQIIAVGLFVLLDIIGLFSPLDATIAHAAHLGGALYGLVWFRFFLPGYVRARLDAVARDAAAGPDDVWTHPVA